MIALELGVPAKDQGQMTKDASQIIRRLPVIMIRRYRVNVSGVVIPSPVGVAML